MFIHRGGMTRGEREQYLSRPAAQRDARTGGGMIDLRSLSSTSWSNGFHTYQGQPAVARLTPQAEAQRDRIVRAGGTARVKRWTGSYGGSEARLTVTEVV